ncbi:hypothetical protein ACA910_021712 [Epithemia clementina (nom. ined.)]
MLPLHAVYVDAFVAAPSVGSSVHRQTCLGITAKEILDRARKASGLPEDESAPMIFDEDILSDMQSALLKLERRVQEGPGSLSILEVEELDGEMSRIVDELHKNPHRRASRPSPKATDAPPVVAPPSPRPIAGPIEDSSPKQALPTSGRPPAVYLSEEEGPAYDGIGGMGQPRGTVNTYVIDGMDGMSPEEYQKALQDSIIERQQKRRSSGVTGNRATWDYLSSLGGSTGVIKEDKKDDDGKSSITDKKSFKPF